MACFVQYYVCEIHVVACSKIFIYFLCCKVFHCMNLSQSIYPCTMDGHEVCFQFGAMTNNAGISILLSSFFFFHKYMHICQVYSWVWTLVTPRECVC